VKYLFIISGVLLCLFGRAQEIDSLEKVLSATANPGVDLLVDLSDAWSQQDREKSLEYAEKALTAAQKSKNRTDFFTAQYQLARALEARGSYEAAHDHADAALTMVRDSLYASDVYHLKGTIFESQSDFDQSLAMHLKALKIRQSLDDLDRLIESRNSLAFVYRGMRRQKDAIAILQENLETCRGIGDEPGIAKATFNIGLMKLELNQHAEAIPWFKEAVKNYKEEDNPALFARYYNNLANCYEQLLNVNASFYDSALYYGHKSLKLKEALKNPRGIANSHNQLAATYERASDYKNSYYHSSQALKLADSLGFKPIKLNALNYLITAELGLGKIEETNDHFVTYMHLQEEISEEAYSETLSEMAAKYESEKHSVEKAALISEASEHRRLNLLLGVFLVISVAGLSVLVYLFFSRRKAHSQLAKDKEVIEEQSKTLRELNTLKSNFFASISHELRTPLTLIQGHAEEVMRINKLPASASEPLRKIKRNIHQLSVMVNDLLDLSRLELKPPQVDLKPVDINGTLKRLCAAFTSLAESKKLSFKYVTKEKEAVAALLDEHQFEKVINNLIYNAFKFSRAHGEITITLSRQLEGIQVEISDTGVGISEEELPYIFDRFFQPKNQTPQSFGSGMGLAIARELTEIMGGEIRVRSRLGFGSTFTLIFNPTDETPQNVERTDLPIDYSDAELQVEMLEIPSDTRVMIVEDNTDVREYLMRVLRDHFSLIPAANGQEALELLEKEQPDLILTDVMMPVMNGWELLENLQSKPKLSRIPVIVLTAVAESKERVKGLRMGVDDYILKPFETEELLIRISNVVNNLRERIKWAREFEGEEEDKKNLTEEHELVLNIKNYVLEHIDERGMNVTQMAMELGLSERQLYRKCSEIVGLSPSKLIQEIKLQHARELLLSERFTKLAQIAGAIGFDSTQHFSKLYLERFGKKPSDYFS